MPLLGVRREIFWLKYGIMDNKRLSVALICFDNPFLKPNEGGKRGILTRIESLLLSDLYDVDIYLLNKPSEGIADDFKGFELKANNIYQYKMRSGFKTLVGPYPICVNKRFVPECIEELSKHEYDVAIYEGCQVAKYRLKNIVSAKKHIIYFHDIESNYRREIAKSQTNILLRLANMMESHRFRFIEKRVDAFFDKLWFVSKDECEVFCSKLKDPFKGTYIPYPALEISDNIAEGNRQNRLLYVGDLGLRNNLLSIKWFMTEVYPKIRIKHASVEVKIIGKISEQDKTQLHDLGAVVCGYVEDIECEYNEAAAIICPVLFGAGVKVKTIDSLAHGQIVITTTKGIEGTELENGKHLIVADNSDDMVEKCLDVLRDRKKFEAMSEQGYEYIKANHTIINQAKIIYEQIN